MSVPENIPSYEEYAKSFKEKLKDMSEEEQDKFLDEKVANIQRLQGIPPQDGDSCNKEKG